MQSKANAVWTGSLKEGAGKITLASGVLSEVPYTFKTRFEGAKGTNPEELIAAAHSSCFSMALGAELGKVGITPESIETSSVIVLEASPQGFGIVESRLTTMVTVPGADRIAVEKCAANAKENCPVSKVLNTKISLELTVKV